MTGAPSSTKSTHYHLTTNNNTKHSIMNTHTYIPYMNT